MRNNSVKYWKVGPVSNYIPIVPIKFPGEKIALDVEILNAKKYLYYSLILSRRVRENKNSRLENYFLHLWWLFYQADQLICLETCKHCGKKPVAYVTVIDGQYLGFQENNCCKDCYDKVKADLRPNTFLAPLKLSSITLFETQTARTIFFKSILKMFGLPEKPIEQEMFEIFIDPKKFYENRISTKPNKKNHHTEESLVLEL